MKVVQWGEISSQNKRPNRARCRPAFLPRPWPCDRWKGGESRTRLLCFLSLHILLVSQPRPLELNRMLILQLLQLLLLACTATAFKSPAEKSRFLANTYIVQLTSDVSALSKRGLTPVKVRQDSCRTLQRTGQLMRDPRPRAALSQELDNVLSRFKSNGIRYTLRQKFQLKPEAFHGASVAVDEGTTEEDLLAVEGIEARRVASCLLPPPADPPAPLQAVWPVQFLRRPVTPLAADEATSEASTSARLSSGDPALDTSAAELLQNPDTRNVSVFRRGGLNVDATVLKIRAGIESTLKRRATIPDSAYTGDVFGPHVQTGIDKAHNAGQLGKGIKVSCYV